MFDMVKRSHARYYVEGLREKDVYLHHSKRAVCVPVKVNSEGKLVLAKNEEPLLFNRNAFLRFPSSLTNLGFPATAMMNKGDTLDFSSVMWAFLEEEARSDLLAALEGEHELVLYMVKALK